MSRAPEGIVVAGDSDRFFAGVWAWPDVIDWLTRRCRRLGYARNDEDDLIAATLFKLVRANRGGDLASLTLPQARAYAGVALKNTVIDASRRRLPELPGDESIAELVDRLTATEPDPGVADANEAIRQLLDARTLTDSQAEALVLRVVGGLTFAEMSVVLKISEEGARRLYGRAHDRVVDLVTHSLTNDAEGPG